MTSITPQRLDKWLWFARMIKTRSMASRIIESGKVRVNRTKVSKPSTTIREGDVITLVVKRQVKILKVLDVGKRRGPASEAQNLYEDLSPPPDPQTQKSKKKKLEPEPLPEPSVPKREPGAGRPTKRERRQMDDFITRSEKRKKRRKGDL